MRTLLVSARGGPANTRAHSEPVSTVRPRSQRKHGAFLGIGIAVIVVLSFILGYFTVYPMLDQLFDSERKYGHSYIIEIKTNSTDVYTVLVPVPMNISGEVPAGLLSNIQVRVGSPSLSLVSADHGLALKIVSSGDARIEWSASTDQEHGRYGNMTMTTGAEGWEVEGPVLAWFYCDQPGISLRFFYESILHYKVTPFFASGGGPIYSFHGSPVEIGWQQLEIEYSWVVIN